MKSGAALLALLGLLVPQVRGRAEDAQHFFDMAVQSELHGGQSASPTASDLYLRAARAGLPEAQFNVGVFLDSGRGGTRDVPLAATWYARAAAHGHGRAAFNLGQLYEAGDGVPHNTDLARAWFMASNLPAALARAKRIVDPPHTGAPTPPELVSPRAGEEQVTDTGLTEFVWTSAQQSGPAEFLVEICAIEENEAHEIYAGRTNVSSIAVLLPGDESRLAWHVTTIVPEAKDYAVSKWMYFRNTAQSAVALQKSDSVRH